VAAPTVQKKLSFAEAAGTPQKPSETIDTTKSTAITPEPKTGPTVTLNTKSPTMAEIPRKENNIANNEQNKEQIESDEEIIREDQLKHQRPKQTTTKTRNYQSH
jgi:hypothetical protein